MTANQLNKMQEESIRRHAEEIDKSFEFFDECVRPRRKTKKLRRDLMAAQIPVPCTSTKKQEDVMKEPNWLSTFDKPYVPKPVQEKKKIFKSPAVIPDPPKQTWERPKAIYSNSKSPYGIYDELKQEWK